MTTPHELRAKAQALPTGHPDRIKLLQQRLALLALEADEGRKAEAKAAAQRHAQRQRALQGLAADLAIQASTLRPASPERNAVEAAHRHVLERLRLVG